jgi:hypothetical protein
LVTLANSGEGIFESATAVEGWEDGGEKGIRKCAKRPEKERA